MSVSAIKSEKVSEPEQFPQAHDTFPTGRIFRKSLGKYWVHTENKIIICSISNRLRKQLHYPIADPSSVRQRVVKVTAIHMVDPVAVGDMVVFGDNDDGTGIIRQVLPRKNKMTRKAAGPKPLEQIIAANIDQVLIVIAVAQPKLKLALLDRYLLDAEAANIPAAICLTKLDLLRDDTLLDQLKLYERIGYPVYLTSAQERRGLEEIQQALKDKITMLTGISGVGKSTLLNTLQPGLGIKVAQVSQATGKGKHTTTHLEMHRLDFSGWVIDTPGMREFGIWKLDDMDIAELFPEMRVLLGTCKFGADCLHIHEPGCVIKDAVQAGLVTEHRYKSYLKLYKELRTKKARSLSKYKQRQIREHRFDYQEDQVNETYVIQE